jgi:hypothetical protein
MTIGFMEGLVAGLKDGPRPFFAPLAHVVPQLTTQALRRLALREREHEIEPRRLSLAVVVNRHQQTAIEQEIASVAPLANKVQ